MLNHRWQPIILTTINVNLVPIENATALQFQFSCVKPKMFGDQTRLNMFGDKTVPVFHDVASHNRVTKKPSNRNS